MWNLESSDAATGAEISPRLSLIGKNDAIVPVAFPYFGGRPHAHFANSPQDESWSAICRSGAWR